MEPIDTCKLILVGESLVGKTSIIERFINDKFYEQKTCTVSPNFSIQNIEFDEYDKTLQFQIWDTAGQERFQSITRNFYYDAKIIILVYDITNEESFNKMKNYWYKEIKENAIDNFGKI